MNRAKLEALRERIDGLDAQEHAQLFEVLKHLHFVYLLAYL